MIFLHGVFQCHSRQEYTHTHTHTHTHSLSLLHTHSLSVSFSRIYKLNSHFSESDAVSPLYLLRHTRAHNLCEKPEGNWSFKYVTWLIHLKKKPGNGCCDGTPERIYGAFTWVTWFIRVTWLIHITNHSTTLNTYTEKKSSACLFRRDEKNCLHKNWYVFLYEKKSHI